MSEPESIERDGVSYVPRLWLQSNRDAFDTCLTQLTAAEARVVEAEHRIDQWTRRVREQDRAMDVLLAARDWYQSEWEQTTERIMVLEAAARGVVSIAEESGACFWCAALRGAVPDHDAPHNSTCPVGTLAALLGEEG